MKFSEQVKNGTDKMRRQLRDAARGSVEDVFEEAQKPREQGGRMPVVSGKLRNSLEIDGVKGAESYRAAAQSLELGDTVRGEWTAPHATLAEFGSERQQGNHFVGVAAARWPEIVEENVRKVKGKG